jgi:hypothetical protein
MLFVLIKGLRKNNTTVYVNRYINRSLQIYEKVSEILFPFRVNLFSIREKLLDS